MEEIHDFIKRIKSEKLLMNKISFYLSDKNSLKDFKTMYFYQCILVFYKEKRGEHFFPLKNKELFNRPIDKVSNPFIRFSNLSENFEKDFKKFLDGEFYEKIIESEYLDIHKNLMKVIDNGKVERILLWEVDVNKLKDYYKSSYLSIEYIKNYVNEVFEFLDLLFELEIDVSCSKYIFKGGGFLKSIKGINYKELREISITNDLEIDEIFYLLVNLDQIYSQNKFRTKNKPQKIIIESDKINDAFYKSNPFENDVVNTISGFLDEELIVSRVSCNGNSIESKFSNFQAFHICKGHKDKQYQAIYNRYLKKKETQEDIFKAHKLAMDILKMKDGNTLVKYLLSLPELPFKAEKFKILFKALDNSIKNGNYNPSVTLKMRNVKGENEDIEFSFLVIDNIRYKNQIRVRNKKTNFTLMEISRDGKVLPSNNITENGLLKNVTPVLELFCTITENEDGLNSAILSYGIETGRCSMCGRELTDKVSKIKGIGPICEKNLLN